MYESEERLSDLRSQLNRDTALAKAELQKHVSEVRMTPTKDIEDWHYVAEGNWDLLGTGPNAPVLGLAHSDGWGGWNVPKTPSSFRSAMS